METRQLPSGTVTLLFTDIEGSTRMLQELGREAYVRALTEHRRLLREAFTAHGGVEVEMQGDSFFFAFPFAREAVAAAVAAQRALAEHAWESQPIKVRIGLHTGEPMQADGLYAGLDVHHAARVMSAAHGGQVVLSARTAELVTGELHDGITLTDLGEHRLKDLTSPQRLYQAGEGDFPPLKTLHQTNLPLQQTPLVGRQRELGELTALVDRADVRLVTLVGPGGAGKTRLSLQAAADVADRFADGVLWVPLAPLPSHELVLPAIARALSVREVVGEPIATTLQSFLGGRQLLLLLDNFEHVLEARSELAALLAATPGVRALVTSRAPLELTAEHVYEVPALQEEEAVELFLDRAARAGRRLEPTETIAALCRRVDALPLAIELAAARIRVLEPEALLERLDHRLPLLTSSAGDRPERQQTLRATINWSHDLLDDSERALFRRLSVFAGSFTVASAEHVAQADLLTLESLLAKSLVRRWGSGRLGMLETIREFAADELAAAEEADATAAAHAVHYLQLAVELEPHLAAGPLRAPSTQRLAVELDNLRAALAYFRRTNRNEERLRLVTAVWRFWMAYGYFGSGRRWLESALACASDVSGDVRAPALEGLGVLHLLGGNLDEGERLTRESLRLFREQEDARGIAETINNLGMASKTRGNLRLAIQLCEEAVSVARAAHVQPVVALATANLGDLALEIGDIDRAEQLLRTSVRLYDDLGDAGRAVDSELTLGSILVRRGRREEALQAFVHVLEMSDELPQRDHVVNALAGIAAAADEPDQQRSARIAGAAGAFLESIGGTAENIDNSLLRQATIASRERLGDAAFDAAYAAGRRLTLDAAVEEALELAGFRVPATTGRA